MLTSQASRFSFSVVEAMAQCISIQVSIGHHSMVCSGVYASPNFSLRCSLWDYLVDLRRRIILPWALIGDFNEILLPSEQRGVDFSSARATRFGNMLDRCGLMDLHFFGTKFTWQRPCREVV